MSFKSMVGRIQLRRLKNNMEPESVAFPKSLAKPKRILICLPGGLRELTLLKQFLPEIKELFKAAEISLLSLPGVRVYDMYPRKGFHILSPTADQMTWSGLPKKSYTKTLKEFDFDLILDLNLNTTPFTSGVLLNFPAAVRVGRGNHLGEPYYNLEIKTRYLRDERNIYRSMLRTLSTIKSATKASQVGKHN
ncbi:MAG: hypothetical protein OEV49_12200 [candidate division Zixibacteria bacterium]|nr:hypothetical protein [candidate division Zixibacteria bacterium]MDH3938187.1 hypothetical protein [candidate division Zixibacteria bacterium]MDH4033013.1 hypothetical protein [candidate division Zixibacteria bacterium]